MGFLVQQFEIVQNNIHLQILQIALRCIFCSVNGFCILCTNIIGIWVLNSGLKMEKFFRKTLDLSRFCGPFSISFYVDVHICTQEKKRYLSSIFLHHVENAMSALQIRIGELRKQDEDIHTYKGKGGNYFFQFAYNAKIYCCWNL